MPTYNNDGTLRDVVERVFPYCEDVIVVNDGCTDNTAEILASFSERITVVKYGRNRGKGYALKQGFLKAKAMGFDYALTIDSDGQHFPEDIPLFVEALEQHPGALIVGSRNLTKRTCLRKTLLPTSSRIFGSKSKQALTCPTPRRVIVSIH